MRVGIIGGGALGLTLAWRRAAAGDEVVVFEKGPEVGGLAGSFAVGDGAGGPLLEKFYHHIFRTDRDVIRLIGEMGLAERLEWRTPATSTLRDGRIYRMDGAFADATPAPVRAILRPLIGTSLDTLVALLRFGPVAPADRLRFAAVAAYLKLLGDPARLTPDTAAAWSRRWFGRAAHEAILEPLLRGKFGARHDEIAMSWLWSRIHERTPSLGYLRGGFRHLYARLAASIEGAGGEVRVGSSVTRLCADAGGRVHLSVAGDTACEVFDRVVVTAPTPVFARIAAGALPADYAARYACGAGAVEHYGAHCVVLALSRRFSDAYWLNVNDPGFPFLALVEHTNFMSPEEYAGRHLLYLGNYLPPDHPLFKTPDAEIIDAFLPHLARINPAFDPSWVRRAWVFQAPFAQPLVTRGYSERLPPHETPVPNVLLANMAHVYPQDRGQNYSIRLAEKVAGMF